MKQPTDDPLFSLTDFFPYQVRMFYLAVSQAVSAVYQGRHGLSVSEWRTLSVLGGQPPLSAGEVVERCSIDKVQVSRAIQRLLKRSLLERRTDPDDRRRVQLQLTERGRALFADLIPRVRAQEAALLAELTDDERRTLQQLMARMRRRAETLHQDHVGSRNRNHVETTQQREATP